MCHFLQVWAEVKLGEERVRILTAIAQASETHVKILQEELCKVLELFLKVPLTQVLHAEYNFLQRVMSMPIYLLD